MRGSKARALRAVEHPPLYLDLGCGTRKVTDPEGKKTWTGVDIRSFPGVDLVFDLRSARWPWDDGSVDEANCSHTIEHFKPMERVHFVNELHRVLKPGAKCAMVVPHWSASRAYGDLTHEWPPVTEFWLFYLRKEWREKEAPHNDFYTCDFDATWGYTICDEFQSRPQDFQQFALTHYREAAQDLHITLIKR